MKLQSPKYHSALPKPDFSSESEAPLILTYQQTSDENTSAELLGGKSTSSQQFGMILVRV